ncbi:MAG: hypothetical protein HC819_19290 [Cyclobacteriaceae bacterium]|nr:hypothetical protein [Cyclobacteriaceae bacterium]
MVLNQVPPNKLGAIVVLNSNVEASVKSILKSGKVDLNVYINPDKKFYIV